MFAAGSRALMSLVLLAAIGLGSIARAGERGIDPRQALEASQAVVGRTIGEHTLLDREGRPKRLADYRGKPLVVSFIYTGCFQVCPTGTRALEQALQAIRGSVDADQFNVVSIGFNQPADSPQAMKAFALQHRINLRNWDFLSPAASDVDALTSEFGFVFKPTQAGFDHLLQVSLVDAQGRVAAQIYGDDFGADRLGEPLRRLLRNQPMPTQLALATLIDRVRVLCTVYDPVTGTYRVSYALAFEVAGGLTFLVAMLWFFALEWRNRRRARMP